ncbi:MAG: FtsX-like permease family protein [Gemmatimonadales bacterium]|jgi:hypothetical protein
MRWIESPFLDDRRLLARARRVLGLGAALALTLPVASLARVDPAGGLLWALGPAALPDAGWPGSWSPALVTASAQEADALGGALALLAGLALLVWLAALADIVLGTLRSMAGDRHGWAVRSAVGATRRQLRRGVVADRLRAAGLAMAIGVAGAALVCAGLPALLPASLDLAGPAGPRMLASSPLVPFVLVVTLVATVGFPLFLMPRPHDLRRPAAHLGIGRRSDARGRPDARIAWIGDVAWWLAAGQVGACIAIVVCTTFLVRGAPKAESTAAAYPYARDTLVLRVRLPDDTPRGERWAAAREAAMKLPRVEVASVSTPGALLGLGSIDRVGTDCAGCGGGGLGAPITVGLARHLGVDGEFFGLLGLQTSPASSAGGAEADDAPAGVAIDETFHGRLLQGQPFGGRRVWLRGSLPLLTPGDAVTRVVSAPPPIGFSLRRHAIPTVYAPLEAYPPLVADLAVRLAEPSPARRGDADPVADTQIAAAARAALPGAQIEVLGRLSDLVGARVAAVRRLGRLTLLMASVAFLLALFGASDAVSERVRERTWEIGLRRALGARRGSVVRLVIVDGARLIAAGVLVGLAVGWSANRGIPLVVDDLAPLSGPSIAGFALVVAVIGLGAVFAATRRALRLDPVAALRE